MLDKKAIEHIAQLARLELTDLQVEEFSSQISKALGFFETISSVKTEGVEPLVTPMELNNFWREDVVTREFTSEEMLANAADRSGNLFKVPPVI